MCVFPYTCVSWCLYHYGDSGLVSQSQNGDEFQSGDQKPDPHKCLRMCVSLSLCVRLLVSACVVCRLSVYPESCVLNCNLEIFHCVCFEAVSFLHRYLNGSHVLQLGGVNENISYEYPQLQFKHFNGCIRNLLVDSKV